MIKSFTYTSPVPGSSALALMDSSNRNLTRVEGLIGPPPVREAVSPLAGRHGATDATRYYGERMITVEGAITGASTEAVLADFASLSAAFAESLYAPATIKFKRADDSEYFAKVRLASEVLPSLEGNGRLLTYQATFRAADPRLYSTTQTTVTLASIVATNPGGGSAWTAPQTSASTTITNSGTVATPFVLTISIPGSTALGGTTNGLPYVRVEVYAPSGYFTSPTTGQFANYLPSTGAGVIHGAAVPSVSSSKFFTWGSASSETVVDTGARSYSTTGTNVYQIPSYDSDYPLLYPGANSAKWLGYTGANQKLDNVAISVSFYAAFL